MMQTHIENHVELRLPNLPEFVAVARLAAAAVASRMAFDVEAIEDIKMAVGEACTNAIEHGRTADTGTEMITISCELMQHALVIRVQDFGPGFDPNGVEPPYYHSSMLPDEEGGLGMVVIEALMDEVTVTSSPEAGTQVCMVKHLPVLDAEGS
jgi:serine/threonine-protein kinase RsbW